MNLQTFESAPPFRENSYLLISGKDAILIDPGADPDMLVNAVEEKSLKLHGILATHGHVDHILAAKILCDHFSCPFMMSEKDAFWLDEMELMCEHFGLPYYGTPEIDQDLSGKKNIILGPFSLNILQTPGHSPGSLCFYSQDRLFSGDTLFKGSVGRCDLTGGNMDELLTSVRYEIFSLPDETPVFPGHMGATTIAGEKRDNPFLKNEIY